MTEYEGEQTSAVDTKFGARLKAARERQGLSQAVLMALLLEHHGIRWHQSTVTKIEAGVRPARLHEAVAVAGVLGLPLVDLLDNTAASDIHRACVRELRDVAGYVEERCRRLGG